MRGLLTWMAPAGLTEVAIAAGPLQGKRFQLDLKSEKALWLGNYEPDLVQTITRFVRPGATVYDIGANIGYHTVYFAAGVSETGKVFAFEPHPDNLERLRHNLTLNGLLERVEVVACAVGKDAGQAVFLLHASPGMGKLEGSLGRKLTESDSITVDVVVLDQFAYGSTNRQPDLIKLDIEGGEVQALQGMRRLLKEAKPVLLLELHGDRAAREAAALLQEMEYSLYSMKADSEFSSPNRSTKVVYAVGRHRSALD
jgi:FkbM family methyltransferase